MKFLLGVDEAGRGPLAGPVSVGVVLVPEGFDVVKAFPGVADSKALSEAKREKIYNMLVVRNMLGDPSETEPMSHGAGVRFVVEFESVETIDRIGIVPAVRRALDRGVHKLVNECTRGILVAPASSTRMPLVRGHDVHVLLDGSLSAPAEYSQETIIHGDALIPIISLASIAAKVERDHLMVALAREYPEYGFEKHKGYGTKAHYEALKKYGLSAIHRRSFIHLDFGSK